MKECEICKNKFKILSSKAKTRKYCYECSPAYSKEKSSTKIFNQSEMRRKMKQRGIELLGNECQICGHKSTPASLQFHHVDPKEKSYNFTDSFTSWERYKNELNKCILLCSNCHADLHWQINLKKEKL